MDLEVTVRTYERGDEEAIVPLLERALVWPASEIDVPKLDHWHWKYLDNPMGLIFIGLVEDESGLICHSGALPLMITVGGKSYRGVEGADVCRDKERADEEMILKAIRCKYAEIERSGVDFCFSFPVQDMYYPLMREFDYIDTGLETLHFIYVLQPDEFFKRVRMGFLKMIGYRLLTLGKEKARWSAVESSERFQIEDAEEFGPD
ncbi:MAG: GNAT family N-acetyltransferase, partial [Methanomassiliicoccales archaeon]|nr:GNAT family N-acetyltransferase [Methanomassiliicoccales archaeon]